MSYQKQPLQTLDVAKFVFQHCGNDMYRCFSRGTTLRGEYPHIHYALCVLGGQNASFHMRGGLKITAWFDKYGNVIVRYSRPK